jgi:hypothetical protein
MSRLLYDDQSLAMQGIVGEAHDGVIRAVFREDDDVKERQGISRPNGCGFLCDDVRETIIAWQMLVSLFGTWNCCSRSQAI